MEAAAEALIVFTSPGAEALRRNGSRTNPRYSVGADPEVRRCRHLRGRRPDVLARRAAVLATPANPGNRQDHPDLRRGMHDMLRGLITAENRIAKCPEPGRASPAGATPDLKMEE
jgi:multiple sugar transport system substrate-binding protein